MQFLYRLPKIVVFDLTFLITTLPKSILDLFPIFNFSPTTTLAPKKTSLPTFVSFKIDVLDPRIEKDPILTLCARMPEWVTIQKFSN